MVHPPEVKAQALALYPDLGVAQTADQLGVPRGTVSVWVHRAGLQRVHPQQTQAATEARVTLQEEIRDEVKLGFLTEAWECLQQAPTARPADRLKLVTAAAVAIDKYRLEMGEATARTYHEGTDDTDRRIAQLVAEMDRRAKAQAGDGTLG